MSDDEKKILRPVQQSDERNNPQFMFWCPGCKCGHAIWVTRTNSMGAKWEFNGNMERPTFSPSLLVRWEGWEPPVTPENFDQWKEKPWEQHKVSKVCHSFIRDGQIQFLGDCTHDLAGKTVPMEPF